MPKIYHKKTKTSICLPPHKFSFSYIYWYKERSVEYLKEYIEHRATELAIYIIENKTTVRSTAKKFCVSKSTVHIVGVT